MSQQKEKGIDVEEGNKILVSSVAMYNYLSKRIWTYDAEYQVTIEKGKMTVEAENAFCSIDLESNNDFALQVTGKRIHTLQKFLQMIPEQPVVITFHWTDKIYVGNICVTL